MDDHFARCNNCRTLNWDSPLYMRKFGLTGCRRCGANQTRWQGKVSLFERFYLLRWYIWETNAMNQKGQPGDPDSTWWVSPIAVLLTLWRGLRPDLSYAPKGEADAGAA